MARLFPLSARWTRAALVLLGGWLVLEYALMSLLSARIGWGATLTLLSVKGGLGLVLVGVLASRGLTRFRRGEMPRPLTSIAFGVASAVLIALPGLIPTLVGLALFTPSLRAAILRRLVPATSAPPRDFDLNEGEWRELRLKRLARRTPRRRDGARADALEAKPPSV